jgi:hypothetical protein
VERLWAFLRVGPHLYGSVSSCAVLVARSMTATYAISTPRSIMCALAMARAYSCCATLGSPPRSISPRVQSQRRSRDLVVRSPKVQKERVRAGPRFVLRCSGSSAFARAVSIGSDFFFWRKSCWFSGKLSSGPHCRKEQRRIVALPTTRTPGCLAAWRADFLRWSARPSASRRWKATGCGRARACLNPHPRHRACCYFHGGQRCL